MGKSKNSQTTLKITESDTEGHFFKTVIPEERAKLRVESYTYIM